MIPIDPDSGPIIAYGAVKAAFVAILFAAFMVYVCNKAKPKPAPKQGITITHNDGGDA